MSIQERVAGWLDQGRYANFPDRWDDSLFHRFVLEHLDDSTRLLDLGAGAGIVPEMNFKDRVAKVCGVDPDPRVIDNPYLHEGREGYGESIPYEDSSFDLVICDNVLEHLENPVDVFNEVRRVLRPGGRFLAKTPNFWHYVAIGATLTPYWFHQRFNAARGRQEKDTFPTRYRANTPRDLKHIAAQSDLEMLSCMMVEGRPEYLRRWWAAYLLGTGYEMMVNSTSLLERFRVVLIGEFRRPEQ